MSAPACIPEFDVMPEPPQPTETDSAIEAWRAWKPDGWIDAGWEYDVFMEGYAAGVAYQTAQPTGQPGLFHAWAERAITEHRAAQHVIGAAWIAIREYERERGSRTWLPGMLALMTELSHFNGPAAEDRLKNGR